MKKIITNLNNNIILKEEPFKFTSYNNSVDIVIDKDITICKWYGLGSAITESSSYNYSKLDNSIKKALIKDLYSKDKLNLNLARLPIGSCDFSLSSYSYSYKDDLSDFSIKRDKEYIIPMLNDIFNYKKIKLISSPWSPPAFMKNNNNLLHGGKLKSKYYGLYAKYLKQYINEYNKEGFNIDYITMQNEPYAKQKWESCVYSLKEQNIFINDYLINELEGTNTNIILWDHNREKINKYIKDLYIDNKRVSTLGLHWYSGPYYNNILDIHKKYPNLLIFNTEMCCGFSKYNNDWINDAELYLKDIISCMNNGVSAYLDWNVLLDINGGPSHIKNPVKSVVILNEEQNNYIKTPIYYYLTHISKYIDSDYEIIKTDNYNDYLYVVAAKKEKKIVITVLNVSHNDINYNISIDNNYISDIIEAHSINTFVI